MMRSAPAAMKARCSSSTTSGASISARPDQKGDPFWRSPRREIASPMPPSVSRGRSVGKFNGGHGHGGFPSAWCLDIRPASTGALAGDVAWRNISGRIHHGQTDPQAAQGDLHACGCATANRAASGSRQGDGLPRHHAGPGTWRVRAGIGGSTWRCWPTRQVSSCYARVAEPTRIAMQQVLDSGADGVIVPHVDNLAHAARDRELRQVPAHGRPQRGRRPDLWLRRCWADRSFYAAQNRRMCAATPWSRPPARWRMWKSILKLRSVDGIFLGPAFDLNMAQRARVAPSGGPTACRPQARGGGLHGRGQGLRHESSIRRDDMRAARDIGLTFAALTDDVTALIAGVGEVVGDAKKIIGALRQSVTSARIRVIPETAQRFSGSSRDRCRPVEAPAQGRGDTYLLSTAGTH